MRGKKDIEACGGNEAAEKNLLLPINRAVAEIVARELWSSWDRMDDEDRRVLLLEVNSALRAAASRCLPVGEDLPEPPNSPVAGE